MKNNSTLRLNDSIIIPMIYLRITLILASYFALVSCTPLAAVSAIGSTVTNATYNQAERDLRNPKQSRDEQALEVAITNMRLGIEYMQQGDNEKALFKLKRSVLAKPDYAPSYNVLGLLYQRLGDLRQAESNFKKSIKLDAADSSTHNNYGLFLCTNGRYDEAISAFLNAANNPLYKSPEIALTNAGICTMEQDPKAAENYFRKALDKNTEFPYALIQMADISYSRNEYQTAHGYFERYKKNARQTPKSLWLGIRICKKLGYQDDVSSYALALRNNYPDTKEAKMLAELNI